MAACSSRPRIICKGKDSALSTSTCPALFLSMHAYVLMAVAGGIGLVWRMKLAHCVAAAAAPIGAVFTFLALVTGAIWGQPMWGTWWTWDPRLTSELILFFLFLGYIFLRQSMPDVRQADRASAVLALVGVVNVPIIHYSVEWWTSIHQGPSLRKLDAPSIETDMLWPLLLMNRRVSAAVFCVAANGQQGSGTRA